MESFIITEERCLCLSIRLTCPPSPKKPFRSSYSSDGDTVWVTLFVVPILTCLWPSWPFSLSHLRVPVSAKRADTHCQSFFPSKRPGGFPQDQRLQSADQFFPSLLPGTLRLGLSGDGEQRWVCDKSSSLFGSRPDGPPVTQESSLDTSRCPGHEEEVIDENYIRGKQTHENVSLVP